MRYVLLALLYIPIHVFVAKLMYEPIHEFCYQDLDWGSDPSEAGAFFYSALWPATILLTLPVFVVFVLPCLLATRYRAQLNVRKEQKEKEAQVEKEVQGSTPTEMEKELLSALGLGIPDKRQALDYYHVGAYIQSQVFSKDEWRLIVLDKHPNMRLDLG